MKKLFVFAAGALLSLSASAGYIQYDLTGPGLSNGGIYMGKNYLVIREEDKSIAYFNFNTGLDWFRPSDRGESYHQNFLLAATTSFTGLGPTNVYMRDLQQEDYTSQLWLLFSGGDSPGTYNFSMRIQTGPGPYSPYPALSPRRDTTYTGTAVQVPIISSLANYLDSPDNVSSIRRIVPYFDANQVPEPASLALVAIGALGALGAARRRSAQKRRAA